MIVSHFQHTLRRYANTHLLSSISSRSQNECDDNTPTVGCTFRFKSSYKCTTKKAGKQGEEKAVKSFPKYTALLEKEILS